ncbi:MAG: N-formylglutamate amidohydrolase [Oligoflexia bacterium]|jgi:N-formylglutamate deformylase
MQQAVPATLIATIPHSGEWIPPEAFWLKSLSPSVLLMDVDRFVDRLFAPALQEFKVANVVARAHRYAVDLNRTPDDIDAGTVQGAPLVEGTHTKGFHWAKTTQGQAILNAPLSMELHQKLIELYNDPFHLEISRLVNQARANDPKRQIFHLDCHSMPSQGTAAHADTGARRPDVVISDFEGKSSRPDFVALIVQAFTRAGLRVSINWPYKGGRITQRYGKPAQGHHTVQIELNRALYMNESTREAKPQEFASLQDTLRQVLGEVDAFVRGAAPAAPKHD